MANSLATTGSGHNALQITQQYPAERFNLLVPMQTVAEIAAVSYTHLTLPTKLEV